MKITILGSGCGVPSLKRSGPGILVESKKLKLLFDCGPGTLKQLLRLNLDYRHIDKVLFTHLHTDHIADLGPFLFASKYEIKPRIKNLELTGPKGLKRFYKNLLRLYDNVLAPERYKVLIHERSDSQFKLKNLLITTLRLRHTKEVIGYRLKSPKGKVIVYSGDTDYCENLLKLSHDADLLILECSFADNLKVPGHLTPTLAARVAQKAQAKKLVLTHIYPIVKNKDISGPVKKIYKGNLRIAKDFLSVTI